MTIAIALYAVRLSAYVAISAYRQRTRRIEWCLHPAEGQRARTEEYPSTDRSNPRRRPVTLTGCCLLLPSLTHWLILGDFSSAKFRPSLIKIGVVFSWRHWSSVETGFTGQIALRVVSGTLASYGERAALVGKVEEWANCNRSWLPRVGFARQWRAHQQKSFG